MVAAPACTGDRANTANGGETSAPLNVIVPPGIVYAFADMATHAAAPAIAIRQHSALRSVSVLIVFPLFVVLSRLVDTARTGGCGLIRTVDASDDNKRTPINSAMAFRLRSSKKRGACCKSRR
ncbi:hypothetical protein BURKHO8Y_140559 [Burkholderia sp. 8Y]|nr:hypothetical protein BURKHO8Y_140559 [Burkholderia sp. 8Y]